MSEDDYPEVGEALTILRDHRAELLPRVASYWRICKALELRSQGLSLKAAGVLLGRAADPSHPVVPTRVLQLEMKGRRIANRLRKERE